MAILPLLALAPSPRAATADPIALAATTATLAGPSRTIQSPPRLYLPLLLGGGMGPRRVPSATLPPSPEPTLPAAWPSPTWPLPTPTRGPLPTGTPEGWREQPPPARLVVPGQGEQAAGVAAHCWQPNGLCFEWGALPTPLEPLVVSAPFAGRLLQQPIETPREHQLTVWPLEQARQVGDWDGWRWWEPFGEAPRYDLLLQREQDIQIAREPGRYLLEVYIAWSGLGDVHYGFLVELRAEGAGGLALGAQGAWPAMAIDAGGLLASPGQRQHAFPSDAPGRDPSLDPVDDPEPDPAPAAPSGPDQDSPPLPALLVDQYRPMTVAGAIADGRAGGVAVGPDGSSYVMDLGDHRLLKFDPEGAFERSWGGLGKAEGRFDFRSTDWYGRSIPAGIGLDVAPDGTVYVAELANHRVQRFSPEGRWLGAWGGYGEAPGRLRSPVALDVDYDGTVWVNDFDNRRLQRFGPEGDLLASWSTGLERPLGLVVSSPGLVYVADAREDAPAIVVFDAEGRRIARWPLPPEGEGRAAQAPLPIDLDLSERGSLMALVWRGQRSVLRLDALTGSRLSAWGAPLSADGRYAGVAALAVSPDETVFQPDPERQWLSRHSLAGHDRGHTEDRASLAQGRLEAPAGLAAEAEGGVWIADRGNDRVQRFDALGRFDFQLGGPDTLDPAARLSRPSALAPAPDGRLLVADSGHSRLAAFDLEGRLLGSWGELSRPAGVTIGPDARIYVADTGRHRIQIIEADGRLGPTWGGWGTGPGQLDSPSGLAVDPEGNLRVVDTGNHRVQVFSPEGEPLRVLGFHGAVDGQLRDARDLALGADGRMWVADPRLHRLQRFDALGRALLGWGFRGWNPGTAGRMEAPEGVAPAPEGGVWVADAALDRIQRLDAGGAADQVLGNLSSSSSYDVFAPEGRPDGGLRTLLAGPDGRLHAILGWGADRVETLTAEGRYLGRWLLDGRGPAEQPLASASAWAIGPEGLLHVAELDRQRSRVLQLTAEGAWVGEWALQGSVARSLQLAVGPDRSVYLLHQASPGPFVQRYRHDGRLLASWALEEARDPATGIAVAPDGQVYVARDDRVERYGPEGGLRGQLAGPGQPSGQCRGCQVWLAIGPEGTVHVGDWADQRIHRFAPDDRYLGSWGPDHRADIPPWDFPGPFVVLPDGRVVVASYGTGLRIYAAEPPEGWQGRYHDNRWLAERPLEVEHLEALALDWGSASPSPGRLPRDGFSARFTRWLRLPPGLHRLSLRAEGGLRLWIDQDLVLDAWEGPRVEARSIPILAMGQWQRIELEYNDPGGDASLEVDLPLP